MHEAWLAIIKTDWGAKNPLPSRAIAARQPGFVHDLEVLPEAERADLEWFTDFAPKWNLGPSMGTVLQVPNGNRLLLTFERPYSAKPYTRADASRFDVLRPSVARAVSLSSQLAFRQFQQTTALLGSLGLPGAVINERGKLLNANLEFETLIPSCFLERQRRTHIRHSAADTLFQEALARIRPELWSGTIASIPVPHLAEGDPPFIVHVLPIRGVAQDILLGATCVVVVDRLSQRSAPSDVILRALYDLTPAEARVAAALVQSGGGPKRVA